MSGRTEPFLLSWLSVKQALAAMMQNAVLTSEGYVDAYVLIT